MLIWVEIEFRNCCTLTKLLLGCFVTDLIISAVHVLLSKSYLNFIEIRLWSDFDKILIDWVFDVVILIEQCMDVPKPNYCMRAIISRDLYFFLGICSWCPGLIRILSRWNIYKISVKLRFGWMDMDGSIGIWKLREFQRLKSHLNFLIKVHFQIYHDKN